MILSIVKYLFYSYSVKIISSKISETLTKKIKEKVLLYFDREPIEENYVLIN